MGYKRNVLLTMLRILEGNFFRGKPSSFPEQRLAWPTGEPEEEKNMRKVKEAEKFSALMATRQLDKSEQLQQLLPSEVYVVPLEEAKSEESQASISDDLKDTWNFFSCLAFRLGWTLAEDSLPRRHEENVQLAFNRSPADLKAHMDKVRGLEAVLAGARTNQSNTGRKPQGYIDIIRELDPKSLNNVNGRPITEEQAREIVRKKALQELHANKSAEWVEPPRVPVQEVKGKEVSEPRANGPRELFEQPKLWSWARPEVSGKKPKYFALNRWPLRETALSQARADPVTDLGKRFIDPEPQTQFKITMMHFRSRSRVRQEEKLEEEINDAATYLSEGGEEEDTVIPWKDMPRKTKIYAGQREFWQGETPSQKREFERRLRESK